MIEELHFATKASLCGKSPGQDGILGILLRRTNSLLPLQYKIVYKCQIEGCFWKK